MKRSISMIVALVLFAPCCPQGTPIDDGFPSDVSASAAAPATVVAGTTAELAGGVDAEGGNLTYRWFQTSGRVVQLQNADAPVASFTAPSMERDQTLTFRLDVLRGGQVVSSAEVTVLLLADPNYAGPSGAGTGGGGTGNDGSGGGGSGGDPSNPFPRVIIYTNRGNITVELDRERSPVTVQNFLRYVDDGFYSQTLIHRVVKDFVIQGGGYDTSQNEKQTRGPIINEAKTSGLKNNRGTIGMARLSQKDSATSQWYINLKDNNDLDPGGAFDDAGYAVFGRVVAGMDVVDAIAQVPITSVTGKFASLPVDPIIVSRVSRE